MNLRSLLRAFLLLLCASAFALPARAAEPVKIVGYVLQRHLDGLLVVCRPADPKTFGVKRAAGTIFLKGHPQNDALFDKAAINCRGTATGLHEYTSTVGARRTVQEFQFEAK